MNAARNRLPACFAHNVCIAQARAVQMHTRPKRGTSLTWHGRERENWEISEPSSGNVKSAFALFSDEKKTGTITLGENEITFLCICACFSFVDNAPAAEPLHVRSSFEASCTKSQRPSPPLRSREVITKTKRGNWVTFLRLLSPALPRSEN
jgi:hypothetical protein